MVMRYFYFLTEDVVLRYVSAARNLVFHSRPIFDNICQDDKLISGFDLDMCICCIKAIKWASCTSKLIRKLVMIIVA